MKWIVDESMKYLASEGGDAGWNLAVEVGADDKPTGRELHVTAPTPDMALDAAKVLAAHFSTANDRALRTAESGTQEPVVRPSEGDA